jgi:ABC-type uncharacterized transport system substrate-binding protein
MRCLPLAVIIFLSATSASLAHPHVWITGQETVVFDNQGQVAAIRHSWVFDEMYSAFATQGIGKDGKPPTKEDLAPLAKSNVEQLADFNYFTYAKADGQKVEFAAPTDYALEARPDKIVVLTFTLPLKTPIKVGRAFSFQVYDPTYYVAFSYDEKAPVAMAPAPNGCSASVLTPPPLLEEEKQKMTEAYFANMSPGANFGLKLSSRIIVACP